MSIMMYLHHCEEDNNVDNDVDGTFTSYPQPPPPFNTLLGVSYVLFLSTACKKCSVIVMMIIIKTTVATTTPDDDDGKKDLKNKKLYCVME